MSVKQLEPRHHGWVSVLRETPCHFGQWLFDDSIACRLLADGLLRRHSSRNSMTNGSRLEQVESHTPAHIWARVVGATVSIPIQDLVRLRHAWRTTRKKTRSIVRRGIRISCHVKHDYEAADI